MSEEQHPIRDAILDSIRNRKTATVEQIVGDLGMKRDRVVAHVYKLLSKHLIVRAKSLRNRGKYLYSLPEEGKEN